MHVWGSGKRKACYTGWQRRFSNREHGHHPYLIEISRVSLRLFYRSLKTNSLLILACIAASLWAWQQDPAFAERNLIFSLRNFEEGRFWTVVVALFVHANVLHLFGNMLFLFVFGRTLEKTVGPQQLLAIFFTGGFLSFILGPAFLPRGTGMLGASAAIFALAGSVMLVRPLKFSWLFLAPQGLIAIIYFIYNVVLVSQKSRISGYDPQVAYVAHIIGFITGIPFGIALTNRWKQNLLITLLLLAFYLALVSGGARSLFR
jgi:membrane associated rhomboid family serine protease